MRIIIINGSARSGKDKFTNFFKKHYDYETVNWSTVDKVKEIAKRNFNWDGKKTDDARLFLSELKRIWNDLNDGPFEYITNKISKHQLKIDNYIDRENMVYFIHCREPEEIQKFIDKYKNCITILLKRDDRRVPNNNSDKNVNNFDYDYIIDNNGIENDLKNEAISFINKINKDYEQISI